MKTKSKIKEKIIRKRKPKANPPSPRLQRTRQYQAHYLAIILAAVLLLEGTLFSIATPVDWQKSVSILDVSSQVMETQNDLAMVFQPMVDTVQNVNTFYQLAAIEMMQLLDVGNTEIGSEVSFVYRGISEFYNQASIQMASVLDVSDQVRIFDPAVAGISITR